MIPLNNSGILFKPTNFLSFALLNQYFVRFPMDSLFIIVGVFNAEGPPVPIPNTEVKLCSGENTCLETSREDSSLPTPRKRSVGVFNAEGPPVPIPNTEVKLCCGNNTCLETSREDSSMPTHKQPFGLNEGLWKHNPFIIPP